MYFFTGMLRLSINAKEEPVDWADIGFMLQLKMDLIDLKAAVRASRRASFDCKVSCAINTACFIVHGRSNCQKWWLCFKPPLCDVREV